MKSIETTAARGRAIAIGILSSAEGKELERIMDLGLPESVFYSRASELTMPNVPRVSQSFHCGHGSSEAGLSGLRPQLFLNSELSELEGVASVATGFFEMARAIYLGEVTGADAGDLDVWLAADLAAEVRKVNPGFIAAYGDDRSMLRIDSAGAPAALCSFTALRRLVLKDG